VTRAAGILLLHRAPSGDTVLFLQRRSVNAGENTHDHPGEWCFPGGAIEGDETAEECALRETEEEIGAAPFTNPVLLTRRVRSDARWEESADQPVLPVSLQPLGQETDFTTFLAKVHDQFIPKLNDEHQGFAWAPSTCPPEPLHPGCRIALARLTMDELGVARAIAASELVSPQQYDNLWLFALRITGTGASYRTKFDEHVWRDPSIYLNDEFLARCNGLPVIMEHPKTDTLDTKEYRDRVVGAIMLPYLKDDEVWGIARIQDQIIAKMLQDEQLSTSPAVVFHDNENLAGKLDDGSNFLIEGKPYILDHLAICNAGVWDKGDEPTGVDRTGAVEDARADTGNAVIPDKEQRPEARSDAEPLDGFRLYALAASAARLRQRLGNR
jgi:8-oxo-dGTP pyrophosphatase MutT (NUDIX family)